jgi:Ca2+-binding RTX toxin-like protein
LPQTGERTAPRKEERGDYRNELVEEDDEEVGGTNAGTLWGGIGDDDLRGGLGNDTAYGGNGIDKLYGQEGAFILFGGELDDDVHGRDGIVNNDFVTGEDGPEDHCYADSRDEIDTTTYEVIHFP